MLFYMGYLLVIATSLILSLSSAHASTLSIAQQRKTYDLALTAIQKNNFKTYQYYAKKIEDYPLHQYLEFEYILKRVAVSRRPEVDSYLARNANSLKAISLRHEWIRYLGKHNQWQVLLDYVHSDDPTDIQCLKIEAGVRVFNTSLPVEQINKLWLHPGSQPDSCNPVFDRWKQANHLTDKLLWDRFELSVKEGNFKFARYLATQVAADDRQSATLLLTIAGSPLKLKSTKAVSASDPRYGAIIAEGFRRLIPKYFKTAHKLWPSYRNKLSDRADLQQEIDHLLGIKLARYLEPEAGNWLLANVAKELPDKETQLWQFRVALRHQDWISVLEILDPWQPENPDEASWKAYWQARATELITIDSGRIPDVKALFSAVPKQRDFYSFLAADRLGEHYSLQHQSSDIPDYLVGRVEHFPAIQRALELYALGNKSKAENEWEFALQQMSSEEQVAAAKLALEWGWLYQCIVSLAKAKQWHELNLRFPLAFKEYFHRFANSHQIEVSWLYAIARQESAFNEQAVSTAGARGLLQIMPATASVVAKRYQIDYNGKNHLFNPGKSIELGSAYIAELYQQYDANPYLATASYNAGYSRVKSWLADGADELPMDIWVETIPIDETRKYVKRVMTYRVIYGAHLDNIVRLNPDVLKVPPSVVNWPKQESNGKAGALSYSDKIQ